ncbi:uncharacterized protein LOC8073069 isoform X2 [Sorghum bicolor]|uniref:Uncharacterized protein n=1 Tax=Sorghum bicolor TaxID=4558 RepID=A0A1Z5RF08_SORBI|nr:uncharacterized protein LOC8073069 isoform X2 [Sorghum bicolor]OQU82322.1 hypothetical protein SORBI_3006G215200 [Sorghum bicolor]|eukprot:XP_021318501.1 uncharacterized protein LOC8073069 isoform X2 [Sorghum bicolor]
MGMEAKCGGLAVAASAAVRRPLQPRDTNVAASTVVVGKKTAAPTPRAHPKAGAGTRPGPPAAAAAALPSLPLFPAQCGVSVAAAGVAEVSLAEELEKARERRARLRAAREQTEREMESRAEVMERAAVEWERRAEDQRRLVSELMRLIGMPETTSWWLAGVHAGGITEIQGREEAKGSHYCSFRFDGFHLDSIRIAG